MYVFRDEGNVDLFGSIGFHHVCHLCAFRDQIREENSAESPSDHASLKQSRHYWKEAVGSAHPFLVPFHYGFKHVGDQACHKERQQNSLENGKKV